MTTCREARPLLPLFFDGELEARQMRAVALHSTRCPACERELRELEHLQDAVATHLHALVDTTDMSQIWAGVAPRLVRRAPSWTERWRAWWEESHPGWRVGGPALAALAAVAVLAVSLVQWSEEATRAPGRVASTQRVKIDNSAKLDSMQSSVDSVALVTEPETNTTMLWIMDDSGGAIERVSDALEAME
jgi:anti-sigma factor RsiW